MKGIATKMNQFGEFIARHAEAVDEMERLNDEIQRRPETASDAEIERLSRGFELAQHKAERLSRKENRGHDHSAASPCDDEQQDGRRAIPRRADGRLGRAVLKIRLQDLVQLFHRLCPSLLRARSNLNLREVVIHRDGDVHRAIAVPVALFA